MSVFRDKRFLLALVALAFTVLVVALPKKSDELKTVEQSVNGVVNALPDQPTSQPTTEPASGGGAP